MLYLQLAFHKIYNKYRSAVILLLVTLLIVLLDFVFSHYVNDYWETAHKYIGKKSGEISIDFAPEIWLGLLGLVLGTLIIVISVASQSTPKLIDLYTNDERSLLYIWYIVVSTVHNMFLQFYSKINLDFAKTSMFFNTYLLLPVALLIAVPYVLYILIYTKTSNVINKIYYGNLHRLQNLVSMAKMGLLKQRDISNFQVQSFEAMNQLDDLLAYVSFKEPKGDIMNKISLSIQDYIRYKRPLRDYAIEFFKIDAGIASDISFKTMTAQFEDMEKNQTFYEQKGFRLLGNAYIKLIEEDEFDLASLCAYELSQCGKVAIEEQDQPLMNVVLVRFNTLMRFGIKHGLKNKEARNIYNAVFHYSGYIHHIIESKDEKMIRESCKYFNIYVNEIYRHSRNETAFIFLVDVFTWEFKRILIELHKNNLDLSLQKDILNTFLRLDNLSDAYEDNPMQNRKFSGGVRGFQIALALYYLKVAQEGLARVIIEDILQDHQAMDTDVLRKTVHNSCEVLSRSSPTFWEDTDRGNSNLYFSEDKDQIPSFLEIFDQYISQKKYNNGQNAYSQ
jgi:hypothetical protein